MFLLDTNVLSELRRRDRTNTNVAIWADAAPTDELFVSAITILEIEQGALSVARRDVRQGDVLRAWIYTKILPSFAGRILPVDTEVALRCARLHVPDPKSERDALIAATALVHRLTLVTRDVVDFSAMGIGLLNPWH